MNTILVVAPHADDETLGCGGTILKYISEGYEVHWLIVTGMSKESGFTIDQIKIREAEIENVTEQYGFTSVHQLKLSPAFLDTIPMGEIVGKISDIVHQLQPSIIFTTYRNDAHSDHEVVFDAVMSASKSFRYPFIQKIIAYETISETDFGMKPEDGGFRPNLFIDITPFLEQKLNILKVFDSEIGVFPFPRSIKAVEALSFVRGVQCNSESAESFMILKEIIK